MISDDLSTIEIMDLVGIQHALAEIEKVFGILPVWRGHAEFDWKLRPEVFRPNSKGGQYPEASLILTFMARAESRHQRCPDQKDRFEWLSLARHYVLPTRLMDWTASPLIALYFAVQNDRHDGKDGCLWALQASHMNHQMSGDHLLYSHDDWRVKQSVELAFSGNVLVAMSPGSGSATINRVTGTVSIRRIVNGLELFDGTCVRSQQRLF